MCLRHSNACIHFFSCVAKISSEEFRVTLIVEDRDYRYISKTLILTNVFKFSFMYYPKKNVYTRPLNFYSERKSCILYKLYIIYK